MVSRRGRYGDGAGRRERRKKEVGALVTDRIGMNDEEKNRRGRGGEGGKEGILGTNK